VTETIYCLFGHSGLKLSRDKDMTKYVAPGFKLDGFNCPHCDAYAHQEWVEVRCYYRKSHIIIEEMYLSFCLKCNKYSVWLYEQMLYPISSVAPLPTEDMPSDVKYDFNEARDIVNRSPRAACALLRLSIQKLMVSLGEKGENINTDIGSLVKKGLREKIQKSLDSVRVIGNNAVHPGEIDLKDDTQTATSLFELLNIIVDDRISQPKKVDKIFEGLPKKSKEAIEKRDSGTKK